MFRGDGQPGKRNREKSQRTFQNMGKGGPSCYKAAPGEEPVRHRPGKSRLPLPPPVATDRRNTFSLEQTSGKRAKPQPEE